jgi:signal transduction histidine kinase
VSAASRTTATNRRRGAAKGTCRRRAAISPRQRLDDAVCAVSAQRLDDAVCAVSVFDTGTPATIAGGTLERLGRGCESMPVVAPQIRIGVMSAAVHDRARRLRGRELLRAIAEGTAGAVGEEFLRVLVRNVAEAFGAKLVFVGEATRPDGAHVRVVAGWYGQEYIEQPFEYDTKGTPCALVVENAFVAFPDALARRFPDDTAAIEMGLESYLAVCLRGADGAHLGHLAVFDAEPMQADEDDVAALRIFAARAAAELERRRQAAALAESRVRAIEAADAERRRIGRDLHDGAQQRLMAVANYLTVARRKPGDAGAVLDLAAEELSAANAELRDLARGLYPVALAERGLRGALESLTAGCVVPVKLDVPDAAVPERVALVAYFVVCESLTNVVRYARASVAQVRIAIDAEELRVEVSDDGVGGANPAAGTGLRGLADRVQILGGSLDVTSRPGEGTRITARIPVGTP